jgi:hypothetical protein
MTCLRFSLILRPVPRLACATGFCVMRCFRLQAGTTCKAGLFSGMIGADWLRWPRASKQQEDAYSTASAAAGS